MLTLVLVFIILSFCRLNLLPFSCALAMICTDVVLAVQFKIASFHFNHTFFKYLNKPPVLAN